MGYQTFIKQEETKKEKVHPVWRAIGCVMIVLIPIVAFSGALLFIQYNAEQHWVTWPVDFVAKGTDPYLYIKIGLTIAFSLVLYILFILLTFLANSLFGPSRYGPQDVPQQRYRGKSYKR